MLARKLLPISTTALVFGTLAISAPRAAEPRPLAMRTQTFDRAPDWDALNAHIIPAKYPQVTQNFGYSATNHAGRAAGEMGGTITRATEPAYYGERLGKLTLDDKLSASGTMAVTATGSGGGFFFGWFNSNQPGGSGRPIGSLGMNFDSEPSGGRLAVRLITGANQSCGTFLTPFIPGKYRPTPIRNDGTRYAWHIDYDPAGADGNGQFKCSILGNRDEHEAFEGKTFTVDLPAGYKQQGTVFDHFGLMNMTKAGGSITVYFDDLVVNGQTQDFAVDPGWSHSGNRQTYQAKEVGGAQDFGWRETKLAGGRAAGEAGGLMWRAPYAYYGDRVGRLTLDDRLEARGRVNLAVGGPDSGMRVGWFNSQAKTADDARPEKIGNFLGVDIGGPTRVGHYFAPEVITASGERSHADRGPVMTQGRAYDFMIVYDPAANQGRGQLRVTLGDESAVLDLRDGVRRQGATFDRFGITTIGTGGQQVKVYFDDLQYTVGE